MALSLFSLSPSSQKEWLRQRLAHPLSPRATGLSDGFRFPGRERRATPAAVLVPIVNRPDGLMVLLTLRSAGLPEHAGQISFPGGRVEADDASVAQAALREAKEEVGLLAERVAILGELTAYETVTGYRVTPVVGWVEPPFELTLDPIEVADVFEAPLAFLVDEQNRRTAVPHVWRDARRILGNPLWRTIHLGSDRSDDLDPRAHASRRRAVDALRSKFCQAELTRGISDVSAAEERLGVPTAE